MVYFLNTNITTNKPVFYALQQIYGIGSAKADTLCHELGISKTLKFNQLPKKILFEIEKYVDSVYEYGELLIKKKMQILEAQKALNCYKGIRLRYSLPRRGQRTHTNAQTVKTFYAKPVTKGKRKKK